MHYPKYRVQIPLVSTIQSNFTRFHHSVKFHQIPQFSQIFHHIPLFSQILPDFNTINSCICSELIEVTIETPGLDFPCKDTLAWILQVRVQDEIHELRRDFHFFEGVKFK